MPKYMIQVKSKATFMSFHINAENLSIATTKMDELLREIQGLVYIDTSFTEIKCEEINANLEAKND